MAIEKRGGQQCVLQGRFRAGLSPAMVCVGIPVLGTKLNQYTLSDLNSLLANSLSYGSAKRVGCTDNARRALVALDSLILKGGGTLLCTRYVEKVLYMKTHMCMRTVGIFRQFPEKHIQTREG